MLLLLQDRPFLAGDEVSLADLFGVCELQQPVSVGYDVTKNRPRLTAWLQKVKDALQPHFDDTHKNYLLLLMGWQGSDRVKSVMIHVRLHQEKFWIEEDWTEEAIANDLVNAGVPKEDIVLAFHAPSLRPYTGFAVAS